MGTSRSDIRGWLNRAKLEGATHMLVVCDTFELSDYPVNVKRGEDVQEAIRKNDGPNMTKLMEVYALHLEWESQLDEHRAYHPEGDGTDCLPKMPIRIGRTHGGPKEDLALAAIAHDVVVEVVFHCPFCGSSPAVEVQVEDSDYPQPQVVCSQYRGGCGASGPYAETREQAIAAWNRRDGSDEAKEHDALIEDMKGDAAILDRAFGNCLKEG